MVRLVFQIGMPIDDYLLGSKNSPYPLGIENTLTQDDTDIVNRYRN